MKSKSLKKVSLSDANLLLTITIVVFFLMYIGAMIFDGGAGTDYPLVIGSHSFIEGFEDQLIGKKKGETCDVNGALIITACGLSLVMITGSIDISVGGVVALVSMCCAVYLDFKGGNVFVSLLIALAIGLGFGLVQGFLVAYLDIQPFIVTLAGMFFARGMTSIVHTDPFNVQNEAFVKLKDTRVIVPGMGSVNRIGKYVNAYVEIGVIVAILIVVIMFVMLRWTKLGRSFYAVGGNRQSALMLGINVKKTRFLAHLLSGLLAGIAGYVYFLHVGSGAATHASGMEMNAIASSIIGGTLLTGGVGNIIGTFFGVLSRSTIQNIVSSAGLDQAWLTGITIAAMLCLFLVIQSVVLARKKKK